MQARRERLMAGQLTLAQIDRIDRAVQESGLELLAAAGHRPRRLEVRFPGASAAVGLLAYVWAIRPGGGGPGVRPDDERRVQMTRPADADFAVARDARTLLLGFDPDADLYAAWDFRLRRWTRKPPGHPAGPPVGSPSAQTRQSKLDEAARAGISFYAHDTAARRRDGTKVEREELVVNFRPDYLGAYLTWLEPQLVPPSRAPAPRAVERRRVATERLARDARFAKAVVAAYGERCCFCGLGAGVVEAAHVKPVADGGPDHVTNGIALCPTHHRLFDRGLLLVDAGSLAVRPNERKLRAAAVPPRDRDAIAAGLAPVPLWPRRDRPDARFLARHRALHG